MVVEIGGRQSSSTFGVVAVEKLACPWRARQDYLDGDGLYGCVRMRKSCWVAVDSRSGDMSAQWTLYLTEASVIQG